MSTRGTILMVVLSLAIWLVWFRGEILPSSAQKKCRADEAAWSSEPHPDALAARLLWQRMRAMDQCVTLDPDRRGQYVHLIEELALQHANRLARFLQRHNLTEQFYREDEAETVAGGPDRK